MYLLFLNITSCGLKCFIASLRGKLAPRLGQAIYTGSLQNSNGDEIGPILRSRKEHSFKAVQSITSEESVKTYQ